MTPTRLASTCLVGIAAWLVAPGARADGGVALYVAPAAGCTPPERIVAELEPDIRAHVVLTSERDASARVVRAHGASGWTAMIERTLAGAEVSQRRTLETRSHACDALDAPLRFVIAMIVEHWRALAAAVPEHAAPAVSAPPPPGMAAPPPPARAAGTVFGFGLGAALGTAQSGGAPVVSGVLELTAARARFARGVARVLSSFPVVVGGPSRRADVWVSHVELLWCPAWIREPTVTISSCLGPSLGLSRTRGLDFDVNYTRWDPAVDLLAELRTELSLTARLTLAIGFDVALAALRPRYVYANAVGDVFEVSPTPAFVLRLVSALHVRFGS